MVWLAWIVWPIPSFEYCIGERKHSDPYKELSDNNGLIVHIRLWIRLAIGCAFWTTRVYKTAVEVISNFTIALFTLALWWATLSLVRVSNRQLVEGKRAIKAAEDAAIASQTSAETSSRALLELERPHVFIEISPIIGVREYEDGDYVPSVEVTVTNHGRFPADILSSLVTFNQIGHEPEAGLEDDRFWRVVGVGEPMDPILVDASVGTGFTYGARDGAGIPWRAYPIQSEKYETFCRVDLWYRGFGEDQFYTMFAWRWDHTTRRWVLAKKTRS